MKYFFKYFKVLVLASTDGIFYKTTLLHHSILDLKTNYTQRSRNSVFYLIPHVLIHAANPLPHHLPRGGRGTHPKISAENMRVTSSYQKNALNTFAK